MNYEDVIYGQPSNATFSSKTELVEYSVVLASPASASIRGCSQKKKLGLETLYRRRWMRRLRLLYKALSNKIKKYIYKLISPIRHPFRNSNLLAAFPYKTEYLNTSFFSVCHK